MPFRYRKRSNVGNYVPCAVRLKRLKSFPDSLSEFSAPLLPECQHEMPTHHNLDSYLEEYIAAAGIGKDRKGPLFRTSKGRGGELAGRPMLQSDVWRMIRRRALAAGIETEIGCHTFRATGITAYLKNGGKLEIAQRMANHESARTTGLYDRRGDDISLDEVEKILI